MPDTIIVALITFASGLLGVGIGAFVNIKAMEKESERRLHEEKQACFTRFTSTYYALKHNLYMALLLDITTFETREDLFTQFQATYSNALLICAQPTINPLNTFYFQVEKYHITGSAPADLDLAYESVLQAMRKELHTSKKTG